MKTITILLALLVALSCSVAAQTKADTTKAKAPQTITLNMDRLGAKFQEMQSKLGEADKQIEAWTATRNQLIGKMQAYQETASDSTLRFSEAPKKK